MGAFEEFDRKSRTGMRDGGTFRTDPPVLGGDAGAYGRGAESAAGRRPGPECLETLPGSRHLWPEPNRGTRDFRWFSCIDAKTRPAPAGD